MADSYLRRLAGFEHGHTELVTTDQMAVRGPNLARLVSVCAAVSVKGAGLDLSFVQIVPSYSTTDKHRVTDDIEAGDLVNYSVREMVLDKDGIFKLVEKPFAFVAVRKDVSQDPDPVTGEKPTIALTTGEHPRYGLEVVLGQTVVEVAAQYQFIIRG